MFSSIIQFFYSLLVWIASVLPGKNMGLAIVILSLLIYFILYYVRRVHFKHKVTRNIIQQAIDKLTDKSSENIQKIYENFMYVPWRGLGITFLYAVIFFFFFYVIQIGLSTSPSDISHLYFYLTLEPQHLNYHFIGVNVMSTNYSLWYLIGFAFFLFIHMFLHTARRWEYDVEYNAKHFTEFVIMLAVATTFVIILSYFPFGVLIYWWTYILISLIMEIFLYPKLVEKISEYQRKFEKRPLSLKRKDFWAIQSFANRIFISHIARLYSISKQEAAISFHMKNYALHHSNIIEAFRHQIISDPYVIIVILISIFWAAF